MRKKFIVSTKKYSSSHLFDVYYPASLDHPRDNAVMFINNKNIDRINCLENIENCIVFYPEDITIPESYKKNNIFIASKDPRVSYCLFFRENNITYYPQSEDRYVIKNGAYISSNAQIGNNVTIMPLAYISGESVIGNNVYIGCGVKIMGEVIIGDNVVIRENSVIGADGLSTDRDFEGKAATMPQFGGVKIGNNVQIGALTVIARGAIDDTIIKDGVKIDNSSFISHNVIVGEDTFIVGETIMFGGSSTGQRVFISGNSTIRNKVKIDDQAIVGMGSVVTKNIEKDTTVLGNPAHPKL